MAQLMGIREVLVWRYSLRGGLGSCGVSRQVTSLFVREPATLQDSSVQDA